MITPRRLAWVPLAWAPYIAAWAVWHDLHDHMTPAAVAANAGGKLLGLYIGTAIIVAWALWAWPWLRLLRLRWPVYVPVVRIPRLAVVLHSPPLSPEDVERFRKYWNRTLKARPSPIIAMPPPPVHQIVRRGVPLWLAIPMLVIGLLGIAAFLVGAMLPPGFL